MPALYPLHRVLLTQSLRKQYPTLVGLWRGTIPATHRNNVPVCLIGEKLRFSDGTSCPHNTNPEEGFTHGIRITYKALDSKGVKITFPVFYGWFDIPLEVRLGLGDIQEHSDLSLLRLCNEIVSVLRREDFPKIMIFRPRNLEDNRDIDRAWEGLVRGACRKVFRHPKDI